MPTRTDPTGDRSSDCPARLRKAITWTKEEFTGGCNGVRWHARLLPIGTGFWIERWKDKRGVKQPCTLVCHDFGYRHTLKAKTVQEAKAEALAFFARELRATLATLKPR